MSRPTVLLLAMDDAQQADVRLALKDVANVVRSKTPAELIADEYRNLNPGAAIVAVRPDAPNRFGLIHNVAAAGGVVIVISPTKDPELILRSMRAGAREFVLESDHEELRLAVRTHAKVTVARRRHRAGGHHLRRQGRRRVDRDRGQPGRGRCSAAALRVVLVDLDLHLGDVLSFLDVAGTYSITDVLANMSRLDRELLATSVTKHRSGHQRARPVEQGRRGGADQGAGRLGAAGVPAPQLRLRDRRRRARLRRAVAGGARRQPARVPGADPGRAGGAQRPALPRAVRPPAVRPAADQAAAQPLPEGVEDHRRGGRARRWASR